MNDLVRVSKFLSKHLRHTPEAIGIKLAPGGWVGVPDLLAACGRHGFPISPETLRRVVQESDKQRFSFDDSGERIRANQGHSTPVELNFEVASPPQRLYHGTATRFLPSILEGGLKPMGRHHVHLSPDTDTAARVGVRHGRLALLEVDAGAMAAAGYTFYRSVNGVWLVDEVPARSLRLLGPKE